MENLINELKEINYKIIKKQLKLENNRFNGAGRVLDILLSDDYTGFSRDEQEAFMIWQAYSEAISALHEATAKLEKAVEIENESNFNKA